MVGLDDLLDTGVGARDEGEHGENDEDDVLDESPLEDAEVARFLPEGDDLDHGRAEETQDGEADRSHQGDEGLQVRQSDGNGN